MNIIIITKGKMIIFVTLFAGIFIPSATFAAFGQTSDPDVQTQRRIEEEGREKNRRAIEIASNQGVLPERNKITDLDSVNFEREKRISRARASENRAAIRAERKKVIALRAPNSEDSAKYGEFLKQPKTGLFRLFPDLDCESKNLIRVDGDCANAVSFSSAFSFRREDYADSDSSDIRFRDGNLTADGFLSQEILVNLGDAPLENISLASGGMKFLADFKPETNIQEAKKQFKQIAATVESGGFKYGKTLRADLNTTYAARIVAYRNGGKNVSGLSPFRLTEDEKKFQNLKNDKRIDLTIAFRVIRKDTDGNVTILWKELTRQDSPKLIFPKNAELSDIK